jgi:pimeloyl-ACP methyl ester carboxylesterase
VIERRLGGLSIREWGEPDAPGILLWPGLGANAAYFAAIAESLPGRAVAVDPPGVGNSTPIDRNRRDRYAELARAAIDASGCRAMVGHSLGGYVALDVAVQPPLPLRAVVLIDGGFLKMQELGQLGMPIEEGRAALTEWLEANDPRFPDWESAVSALSRMLGAEPNSTITAYVHEVFAEAGARSEVPWRQCS